MPKQNNTSSGLQECDIFLDKQMLVGYVSLKDLNPDLLVSTSFVFLSSPTKLPARDNIKSTTLIHFTSNYTTQTNLPKSITLKSLRIWPHKPINQSRFNNTSHLTIDKYMDTKNNKQKKYNWLCRRETLIRLQSEVSIPNNITSHITTQTNLPK
jgi:hypothetical protein